MTRLPSLPCRKLRRAGPPQSADRSPKIEYGRLSSEIGWLGINSRTLTSKRAQLLGKGVQRMSLNRPTIGGGSIARIAPEGEKTN